ncbi:MAG: hypothetical protein IT572_09515 [Deltaproteobacteria bacterium]|nr:hypothetical protein [Deltaproteobacteria bacterium]
MIGENETIHIQNKNYIQAQAKDVLQGLRTASPMQPGPQVTRDSILQDLLSKYRQEIVHLRDSVHEFIARTGPILNAHVSNPRAVEKEASIPFGSPLAGEIWGSIAEIKVLRETVRDAIAALEI